MSVGTLFLLGITIIRKWRMHRESCHGYERRVFAEMDDKVH